MIHCCISQIFSGGSAPLCLSGHWRKSVGHCQIVNWDQSTELIDKFSWKKYISYSNSANIDIVWFHIPGLRYEDLLNEDEKEVKEALELADPEVLTARTRRLKRAIDLSYKRKSLQDYAPNMELDLFKSEIYPDIEKIRARDQEYAQLNAQSKV